MEEEEILTEGEPYPVETYLDKHSGIPVNGILGVVGPGGMLINQKPEQGAINPHECHNFYNGTVKARYMEGATHISYHMTGLYPVSLEIDHVSGVISGLINIWNIQPAIKCEKPELMKLDGRNWMNMGRPQARKWIFNFGVYSVYHYTPPNGGGADGSGGTALAPEGDYKTDITPYSITVIRTNDMDTLIFGLCYMLTEETCIPVNDKSGIPGEKSLFVVNHNLNIYGKRYSLKNFDEWVKNHPGPFPRCDYAISYIKKLMGVE